MGGPPESESGAVCDTDASSRHRGRRLVRGSEQAPSVSLYSVFNPGYCPSERQWVAANDAGTRHPLETGAFGPQLLSAGSTHNLDEARSIPGSDAPQPPQHDTSLFLAHRRLMRSSVRPGESIRESVGESVHESANEPSSRFGLPLYPGRRMHAGNRSISLPQKLAAMQLPGKTRDRTRPSEAEPSLFKKLRVASEHPTHIGRSRTDVNLGAILLSDEAEDLAITDAAAAAVPRTQGPCVVPGARGGSAVQRALAMHDVLRRIFEELDAQTIIPQEIVQERRKPVSLMHARLLYGNTPEALEAWLSQTPATTEHGRAGLYNCLFVNRLWHDVAMSVLAACVHFRSNEQWTHFARRGAHTLQRKPRALVLHKLSQATQVELELLDSERLGEQLEWLEFYTCPRIAPTKALLGEHLLKLVLPGCNRVNDQTLFDVAQRCPRLEHLDVRACDRVSDTGVKVIARYCPNLQLINVGRTVGGERITYKAIKHLARLTHVSTLGLAGCDIDDRAVWELALNRGPRLERLSLNNCRLLTDAGLPRVLGYMPNLTVLEIRGCHQITNMRPIALLKLYNEHKGRFSLIEGCEVTERCIQVAVARLRHEMKNRRLADLAEWVNRPNDTESSALF